MEESNPSSLSLSLDEKTGELRARFDPSGGIPAPDLTLLREMLTQKGWGKFYFDDNAAITFLADSRKASEPLEAIIGARRDGEFSISVDTDLMTVWMTLIAPQGGKAPTVQELGEVLVADGIIHGIQRQRIDAAFAAGECERIVIAEGQRPQEGRPTRFDILFDQPEEEETEASEEDDLDRIKYTDLCHILLVKPGDKLMRRIPPIPGKNGVNVKGQEVLAKQTPDIPFAINLQGAEQDQKDPELLIATLGGQPVVRDRGVLVNPVLDVVDVDLSTGSLTFEGTLRVGGDIKAGMRVNVTGDVIVNGAVEAAEIVAGGNVAIRGGVVGHPDSRPGATSLPETTARIFAEGSVQALFMENAHVEAGKLIQLERSARQCELLAREEIIVGKPGVKNGQIVGGRTQATVRVATPSLGSATGIKTFVQVGSDPYLDEQLAEKEKEYQRKCDELDRVIKLQTYFKQNPAKGAGGVAEKVEATRKQLLAEIDKLTVELKELRSKLELAEGSRISISNAIYYGTEIRIGQLGWQAPDDMGGAVIRLEGGKISVGR